MKNHANMTERSVCPLVAG